MVLKKTGRPAAEEKAGAEVQQLCSGKDGIVWATYNPKQAEVIRNALLAQHIHAEIMEQARCAKILHLVSVMDPADTEAAIDFIWRSESGLVLKPDWNYPAGECNKSFERWVSGNS